MTDNTTTNKPSFSDVAALSRVAHRFNVTIAQLLIIGVLFKFRRDGLRVRRTDIQRTLVRSIKPSSSFVKSVGNLRERGFVSIAREQTKFGNPVYYYTLGDKAMLVEEYYRELCYRPMF